MRRCRSIRWTLIGWFGLLLAVVLAVFGAVLFREVSTATMTAVDLTLEARAHVVATALDWDEDTFVPGRTERGAWELELSSEYLRELGAEGWFTVWDERGRILATGGSGAPERHGGVAGARNAGDFGREVELPGPSGSRVVVGRSVARERDQASAMLASIVGTGVAILAFAMLGGWWLARRSVTPIELVAASAAAISERDLSARLDAAQAPTELHGLIGAFNASLSRLEAAFARQTRFTADASHELRTPVAIVRTQAESVLQHDRPAGEYREALSACQRAAARMTSIVEGLLTLARADAGEAVTRSRVDLAQVIEEATADAADDAAARDVHVTCCAAPVVVEGDPALLAMLATNLVTNAIRYNRPGGRVEVNLAACDGTAEIRVRDTGIGIPAAALPHVFDRFYRVDPARSRASGGSGLGLAITRWIVEAHGGTIEVHSVEGDGSTFTVRLPRS